VLRDGEAGYQVWAQRVREAGLGPALVILLEMIKPVGILCGELLEAASAVGGPRMSALGRLFQEPEAIAAVQALIMREMPRLEGEQGDA